MCTDYMDLNKAYLTLSSINQLVDDKMLSFLDAYSGYNQIVIYHPNKEKIAFITKMTSYCDAVMPFDLKSTSVT